MALELTSFENSRDTGELFGIARVLEYGVRNKPRAPHARLHRVDGYAAELAPPRQLVQVVTRVEDGVMHFPGTKLWSVPVRQGRRTLLAVYAVPRPNRPGGGRAHEAEYRCDCGCVAHTPLHEWRKTSDNGGGQQCRVCARQARRKAWKRCYATEPGAEFERLTTLPYVDRGRAR
jgi:hypothetical protein